MDYNSNRKKLPLPEYGRNIQNMVDHILTLEDKNERNRASHTIIEIMGNMFPYLRDIPDFKHKLWDHLAIMAEFKLDIDYPYDPPKPEVFQMHPSTIPYSVNRIKYRHYGKTLESMINVATDYEPEAEREVLVKLIANHMKKSYISWNKDAVEDNKIFMDLAELSKGKIRLADIQLAEVKEPVQKIPKSKKKNRGFKRT